MKTNQVAMQDEPEKESTDKNYNEKERMLAGYPFQPSDPQLMKERQEIKKLIREFNKSPVADEEMRNEILKQLFHPSCKNKKLFVEPPFRVEYGRNIIVGNNFQANFDCVLLDSGKINIGDNCLMACGVHIYSARMHTKDNEEYCEVAKPVTIGNNCWIGGQTVICPGVTIGDNVTIGAGAVVTEDIPSNVVVGGNPAKIIKFLPGADPANIP